MIKIFIGSTFTFDNISSEDYGLKITILNNNDTINIADYKSNLEKSYRQNKFLPKKQYIDKPTVLNISIFSDVALTRSQFDQIHNWLFNIDGKFRKLRIHQNDMLDYYYNCRLQQLEAVTFGNAPFVLNCMLECDSQYVWQNPITRIYTITTSPYTAKFINISSEDTLKPKYIIKMNALGGTVKIQNLKFKDTNLQTMEFINLQANEIITIDAELGILSSNLRTNILGNFVYPNFMRLEHGSHEFIITGNVSEFKIIYQNARKIGD